MKKLLWILPLAGALAGCGKASDAGLIVASGHVEATEIRIAAKVGGKLESLSLEEGDRVTAGQELARIDAVDLRLSLDSAKADRERAAADLKLMEAGARTEDIAEARAQVALARANLDGAETDFQRMQGLLDAGSGTAKSRDDARTRRDALAASLEAAKERLKRLEAGSRREEIEAARARLRAAEARIAQLDQQIKDATVTSPAAGVVTEKLAEPGEVIAAGTPLLLITDLGDAWLNDYDGEPDLAPIRIGQPAEVRTDDGATSSGTISFIASTAEFTPKNVQTRDERVKLVFRVKIRLPNEDGKFKPGLPAEARLRPAASGS